MTDDPQGLVATASQILGGAGHGDLIWGHASTRDPAGRGVWMKEATWGLEEITPDRVLLVDAEGVVLSGDGPRHSEYPIHTEIMSRRPEVGGVVHVHSKYAVALAAAGQQLLPVSHAANFFGPHGVPRYTETADLILTPELGASVAATLGEASAIFLVNHGIVTVGSDLQEATVAALLLEMACEQQLLTRAHSGWPTWSDPQESARKREHIYSPGSIRAVWDYLVRQLDDRA